MDYQKLYVHREKGQTLTEKLIILQIKGTNQLKEHSET